MTLAEYLAAVRERVKKLRESQHAHEEHGAANGFQEVQRQKDTAADYAASLLILAEKHITSINEQVLRSHLAVVDTLTGEVDGQLSEIERLLTQPNAVNSPDFPNRRSQIHSAVKSATERAQVNLGTFEILLQLRELQEASSDRATASALARLSTAADEAEARAAAVQQIETNLRNRALEVSSVQGTSAFTSLRNNHQKYEARWFWALCVSLVGVVAAVWWLLQADFAADGTLPQFIGDGLRRLVVLSLAGVATKLTLSKYNLERNLRIIYDHRLSVLEQFGTFDSAISDSDQEGKARLRLELAKTLFADPSTGYNSDAASDFNVAPVVNVVDAIAKR